MADPTEKSLGMGMFLEEFTGRTSAISSDKCLDPPFGCGGPATEFRDDLSRREYRISGMCQACQDKFFGSADEEEWEEEWEDEHEGDRYAENGDVWGEWK